MRNAIENWWNGLSSSQSMTLMLQLGSIGTPFPTLILQSNSDISRESAGRAPDLATEHDMVVVRRVYMA